MFLSVQVRTGGRCPNSPRYNRQFKSDEVSHGEVVEPCAVMHQLRCVPRGQYQLYNGKHSEHKTWAPRKVKGWKIYERVVAKGEVGYLGGRRLKGAFVLKDVATGKTILEVTPSKLQRIARCTHGWIASTMRVP